MHNEEFEVQPDPPATDADRVATDQVPADQVATDQVPADQVATDQVATDQIDYRRGPRSSTIIWGLLTIAAGVLLIAWGLGLRVDLASAAAIGLGIAGVALVVAAMLPAYKRR